MLKSLLGVENKFLVLEVLPDGLSGLILSIDKEKKLTPKELSFSADGSVRLPKLFSYPIIVSLAPSLHFNVILPLNFEREDKERTLDKIELENMTAQSVGKIFNQCREEASRYLKNDGLNVVLVESRLYNFRVDGHKVINPLGFRAKKISVFLELGFTKRDILDKIKSLAGNTQVFFTGIGKAELEVIRRIKKSPVNLLLLNPESALFILDNPEHLAFRKMSVSWREDCFYDIVAEDWGVGRKTAENIYWKYLQKEISARIMRRFQKIFQPAVNSLLNVLKKRGVRGRVFFNSAIKMPFSSGFKRQGIILEDADAGDFLDKFGFKISKEEWNMPEGEIFRRLAPFLEFYYNKENGEINRWLRRRLNWLGASL